MKEALEEDMTQTSGQRFSIDTVCALEHDFLEYANRQGAAVGGATGAAGMAPKLLLMRDNDEVFIDAHFAGQPKSADPYLVKFARNNRTARDNHVLQAEASYYKILPDLLAETGITTMNPAEIQLLQRDNKPSLWLPRFDVVEADGQLTRLGVESIYSIIDAGPGSAWDHFEVITLLWQRLEGLIDLSKQDFAIEYVIRDLLNVIFGNSDNHGRNTSFIKHDGKISFAPIYDFAPMKADPEQITRLFRWHKNCEASGLVDYAKVAQELADFAPPDRLLDALRTLAPKLLDVPEALRAANCPPEILEFPAIGFAHLPEKLNRMGLL